LTAAPLAFFSQVLHRVAQAVACGAARCAPQVLGRGAQAVSRGTKTTPNQEKNNSADVKQKRVYITGFICTAARKPSRRCTFGEFEWLAVASRRRWHVLQPFLRRLRLRRKTTA
jgi:hypothetical protein